MRDRSGLSGFRKSSVGMVAGSVLAVSLLFGVGAERVLYADESAIPPGAASYPMGKITAIYQTSFQIDGRTFNLAPDVVIVDRHGDHLEASFIRVDIDAKYHVQRGTTDKIDWLLLILPE